MAFDHTGSRLMAVPTVRTVTRARSRCSCLAASSCATGPKKPPTGTLEPDKFLFERGTEALNSKKWLTSREYFRQLVDSYPQSTYRADPSWASAYLPGRGTLEANVLAINEFREFLSFYPNASAPITRSQARMAPLLPDARRGADQTETLEAIAELSTFVARVPNSPLMDEAKGRLREAREPPERLDVSRRLLLLPLEVVPGRDRSFRRDPEEGPGIHRRDGVYY